ncbi:MAG: hypothetical protein AB7U63_11330 [Porticoccaceae bacterium]
MRLLFLLLSFYVSLGFCLGIAPGDATPRIHLWYGNEQTLGNLGVSQVWENILGNVQSHQPIKSFSYSLNGGVLKPLSLGADGRRLQNHGDFNIEIAIDELKPGENNVLINALDIAGGSAEARVKIHYLPGNIWPLPFTLDWDKVTSVQERSRVVDGLWSIVATEDGKKQVRTKEPGYDRFLAVGDMVWKDYEFLVPVTLHDLTAESGGVGILLRWRGHTDNPISGLQPKAGFLPLGCIGWYRDGRIELYGNNSVILGRQARQLVEGQTYYFRMRVTTEADGDDLYQLRVWPASKPEPLTWDIQGRQSGENPKRGSILLTAHEYDVSFGNVLVTPLY